FSQDNEFINQMSLNGLYTLGHSLLDVYNRKDRTSLWKEQIPQEESQQRVRDLLLAPGEVLVNKEFNTLARVQNKIENTLQLTKNATPPNVVLVLMESFSARVVGACGSPNDCTPEFNKLAQDGILFDRALSSGTHTHQGIFSSNLGFPNLPGYEYLMKEMVSNQPFTSISSILKAQGYQTLIFYNSKLSYDNLYGFFRSQGIDHFVGKDDFTDPAVFKDKVWGVSDHTLFERVNQDLDLASKNGPFFSLIITLSNHAPYDLPQPLPFEPSTKYGDDNKRFDGVRYADWAVGQFIQEAKKRDYFKNTLFVFVGDHGFHIQPVLTETHLLYHHVPLLFYSPTLLSEKNKIVHEVVSQVNIAPTIFGLLELQVPQACWGANVFSTHFNAQNAMAVFKGSGNSKSIAFIQKNILLVYGENKHWSTWTFDLGFPPSCQPIEIDPDQQIQMQRNLMAFVQSATKDLISHKVGVPSSKTP
ncbi:MAG: LTA synthase family protein, partial [Planctomycetota bacterium]